QDAVFDGERAQQPRQHEVGFDLHVTEPGIAGPRAGAAVAGAVVDHAAAARGVAQALREIAPHLDAAEPLVQEDECRALEPVAPLRRQTAEAQAAVAEIGELVAGRDRGHASDVTGTRSREKTPIRAGRTVRKSRGASSMPPTITIASGRCTWLPIAVENAAGNSPTQAATQVIRTGRICRSQVRRSASSRFMPPAIRRLKQPTSMMPFMAAIPNKAMKPMAAEMLNGMPARVRLRMPPIRASGMALPANNVSRRLPKLT